MLLFGCSQSGDKTAGTATDVLTGSISGNLENHDGEAAQLYLLKQQSGINSESGGFVLADSLSVNGSDFLFDGLEPGVWQIQVKKEEILVGQSEWITLEENQNVQITINISITIEQHFTITNGDQYNITNVYLSNGSVKDSENGIVLTLADGTPDTLWFELYDGDSLRMVSAVRSEDASGSYNWDFSQLPEDMVLQEEHTLSSSSHSVSSSSEIISSSSIASVSSSVENQSSSSMSSGQSSSSESSSSQIVADGLCDLDILTNVGSFTDLREDRQYRCIKIGNQIWMGENLNWNSVQTTEDYCLQDDPSYCDEFGRLYTWDAIQNDTLCPQGWKIPSQEQWEDLAEYIRSKYALPARNGGVWPQVGTRLKAEEGIWTGVSDDTEAFSALPAGYRAEDNQWPTEEPGNSAWFFTSTSINWESVMSVSLSSLNQDVLISLTPKNRAMSIRCIQSESLGE